MKGLLKLTIVSFLSFLAILIWAWAASPALAEDIYWSTPAKISQSATNYALGPVITTDSRGYVHSAWMESFDQNAFSYPSSRPTPGIFYSFWNGDVWSTPQQVNLPAKGLAITPAIAVTGNDNIHVVWAEDSVSEERFQVYYSRYNGTSWTTPVSLSAPIHQTGDSREWAPKIVSDTSNNLYVLFSYTNPPTLLRAQLYYRKSTDNGASWSAPEEISQNLDVQVPDLAVDSSGTVHVLLWDTRNGVYQKGGIFYTFYNGSVWSPIQKISTPDGDYDYNKFPRLVIDGGGNLNAAWYYFRGPGNIRVVYARKPAAGAWSAPFNVSTTVAGAYWWVPLIGLTVDNNNNASVGWGQYNSTSYPDIQCAPGPEITDPEDPNYPGCVVDNNYCACGGYGVDAMYRKYDPVANSWSNPILIRSTKYLDAPTIWRDKWWNQHFVWSEMNATRQWEFWYSEVPANTGSFSPGTQLTITMVVTNDTLRIPANALATSATISAQIGPVPASRDPLVTTIPRSYTFRPGTTFLPGQLAQATIRYSDPELLGSNEAGLKVYIWDTLLNNWSSVFPTSVNTGANRLTVEMDHFSLYGIRTEKAPRKVNLTFRPPISNAELYSMTDGSTLPIKFTLAYEDGTLLASPTLPEDMKVYVRKIISGEILESGILEYHFGTGDNNVRYDPGNGQYLVNLKTRELNLGPGLYNIKVLYQGVNWGTKDFQITEPGKVKGASTP